MKWEEIKIGQRVEVVDFIGEPSVRFSLLGRIATIVRVNDRLIEVDADDWTDGHWGTSMDKSRKSRWNIFNPKSLELVPEKKKPKSGNLLPADAKERKGVPIASGVLDYFPAALVEIAKVSKAGNDQHNPGQPLHWARGKSTDQADTMQRHFLERGTFDSDGIRHSAKMCWRALAILQLELEAEGAPVARGAKEGK